MKDNEPTLRADLQTSFADPFAQYQLTSTTDRHRGRIEVRQIRVSSELNAYLSNRWPYGEQVAELTRTVTHQGKTTQEVVYFITSLSQERASPLRLLQLIRGHWHIENGLHSVRDVTDREKTTLGSALAMPLR